MSAPAPASAESPLLEVRDVHVAYGAGVLASTDCGFGTFAGSEMCAPSVVWAKLRALREGADLASRRLISHRPR